MEKFSLKWNDFQTTVSNSFKSLKQEKDFFDVTLIAEDQKQIESHKVILSACSSFFKPILQNNKHSHPLIYLSGINSTNLQFIFDYVYEVKYSCFKNSLTHFWKLLKNCKLLDCYQIKKMKLKKKMLMIMIL